MYEACFKWNIILELEKSSDGNCYGNPEQVFTGIGRYLSLAGIQQTVK